MKGHRMMGTFTVWIVVMVMSKCVKLQHKMCQYCNMQYIYIYI